VISPIRGYDMSQRRRIPSAGAGEARGLALRLRSSRALDYRYLRRHLPKLGTSDFAENKEFAFISDLATGWQ